MNEITDTLIRLAADGNQDAITRLYELTYNSVYKTVKSMIRDEDTVLDIVQDSYIKGFQSLGQLDVPENYRAWMKRIATNKAKDYIKKAKPVLFSEMVNEDGDEIEFQDECLGHCPEEVMDRKETSRLMNEILDTLSEDQRLVIGMFYYEEMTVREIAEILGCSENTVKSRLNYGRKKIEMKVRELEKKGTKLYSLAPLPFLLWLFRMDAQSAEVPSGTVLDAVTASCAATGPVAEAAAIEAAVTGSAVDASAAVTAAAGAGAKAAAGTAAKGAASKVIAWLLALSIAGGGAMVAVSKYQEKAGTGTAATGQGAYDANTTKLDLGDYLSVSYSGTDGNGTAALHFDFPQMELDYAGVKDGKPSLEALEKMLSLARFELSLSCSLDKSEGLHNGDRITATISYDRTLADSAKIRIGTTVKTFTVEGLG